MHRWYRLIPVPNWRLPSDLDGMRQVRACVTTRMHRPACRALPRSGGGLRFAEEHHEVEPDWVREDTTRNASANITCDGMVELYWRDQLV